jgi:hypothetical protein
MPAGCGQPFGRVGDAGHAEHDGASLGDAVELGELSSAVRLTVSPSISPSQPSPSASAMRSVRLSRISTSRLRWAGSGRSWDSGYRRARAGRWLPAPLAYHGNQLLADVSVFFACPQQFGGPGTGDTQNATMARSRLDGSAAKTASNCSSGMHRGIRCGTVGRYSPLRSWRNGSIGLWC